MKKNKQAQNSYKSLDTIKMYFGIRIEDYWHIDYPEYKTDYDGELYFWDLTRKYSEYNGPKDENGVIDFIGQNGKIYKNIISICHYAIGAYEHYFKTNSQTAKESFIIHAEWLRDNQKVFKGIKGVWVNKYPITLYKISGESVSAMTQGMAISVMTRAYRLTGNESYLVSAEQGVEIFGVDVKRGGIRRDISEDFVCFEEYPTEDFASCVLNGFVTALLGLYDLILVKRNSLAAKFYDEGMKSLIKNLPKWDTKIWSLYDLYKWGTKNYASYFYHKYHVKQMRILQRLTGERIFYTYAEKWERSRKNLIFAMLALVKKIVFRLNGRLN